MGLVVFHVRDDEVRVGDGRGAGRGAARRGARLEEHGIHAEARSGGFLGGVTGLQYTELGNTEDLRGVFVTRANNSESKTGRWALKV